MILAIYTGLISYKSTLFRGHISVGLYEENPLLSPKKGQTRKITCWQEHSVCWVSTDFLENQSSSGKISQDHHLCIPNDGALSYHSNLEQCIQNGGHRHK